MFTTFGKLKIGSKFIEAPMEGFTKKREEVWIKISQDPKHLLSAVSLANGSLTEFGNDVPVLQLAL